MRLGLETPVLDLLGHTACLRICTITSRKKGYLLRRGLIFSTLRATGDSLFLCRCQTSENIGNSQPAYEGQTGHRSWTRKSSTHLPLDLSYTAVLRLYCMEAGFTEPRPEITYINESNLLLMAWLEQVPFFSSLQNRNHMDSILCISDSRF